jgi:nicotinamidase-related amidase
LRSCLPPTSSIRTGVTSVSRRLPLHNRALTLLIVTFGESIGKLDDGTDMGGKLSKGSWNSELYGPLKELAEEGIKAGTDVWVWKNRYSGLTGSQPLNLWLEENDITTCFFGGGMCFADGKEG